MADRVKMEKRATVTVAAEGITLTCSADCDEDRIIGPVLLQVSPDVITVSRDGSIGLPAEIIERAGAMLAYARRYEVNDRRRLCEWHGYHEDYDCPRCEAEKAAPAPEAAPMSELGQQIAAIAFGQAQAVRAGLVGTNGTAAALAEKEAA
jgi:hypothetical protein